MVGGEPPYVMELLDAVIVSPAAFTISASGGDAAVAIGVLRGEYQSGSCGYRIWSAGDDPGGGIQVGPGGQVPARQRPCVAAGPSYGGHRGRVGQAIGAF